VVATIDCEQVHFGQESWRRYVAVVLVVGKGTLKAAFCFRHRSRPSVVLNLLQYAKLVARARSVSNL